MRILYLSHHFQTPDEPGAPRPWKVAKYLDQQGHDVTVITSGVHYMTGEFTADVRCRPWATSQVAGVTVVRTNALESYRQSLARRLVSYLIYTVFAFVAGLWGGRYDVVLTGGGIPPTLTAVGYVLTIFRGGAFVIEERDLYPDTAVELGAIDSPVLVRLWGAYNRFLRSRAVHVIALTPGIKRLLLEKGMDDEDVTVVTNAYDRGNHEVGDAANGSLKGRFDMKEQFVVLYTGGFGNGNDLSTLLKAARLLSERQEIVFVLIGDGERKSAYREYCAEYGITNCEFIAAMPKRDLPAYYDVADVCVHLTPSGEFWECMLANKVFDYLGNGCPMIFSGAGDTANLIREADAGLVTEPEDPGDLAAAIEYLADHEAEREKMGNNAREYVLEHYNRPDLLATLERRLREYARPPA